MSHIPYHDPDDPFRDGSGVDEYFEQNDKLRAEVEWLKGQNDWLRKNRIQWPEEKPDQLRDQLRAHIKRLNDEVALLQRPSTAARIVFGNEFIARFLDEGSSLINSLADPFRVRQHDKAMTEEHDKWAVDFAMAAINAIADAMKDQMAEAWAAHYARFREGKRAVNGEDESSGAAE